MNEESLQKLLKDVKAGRVSVRQATAAIKDLPVADLGFATVDTHRALRTGFPEVVFAESKKVDHLVGIVRALDERKQPVLATRVKPEHAEALTHEFPHGTFHEVARIFEIRRKTAKAGKVAVVCAGTSDLPVAEEASVTAEALGATVTRITDVGVAGLHRILRRRGDLTEADAVVVIAGMEGALASVVGGLVAVPVVAVPTSIGYGAQLNGIAALLTMINSCASNVAVVNIDNGFGGGYYAALISRRRKK